MRRFIKNKKGVSIAAAIAAFIAAVIIIIAGVNLIPIVAHEVDSVIFLNASDWNFTGHSGAEAILGLIPFVFIAGILIASIGMTLLYFTKKTGA